VIYPDYNWLPWKFSTLPLKFWSDVKNQRKFLDWASTQLNIKDMSDWYKITKKVTRYHNFLVLLFLKKLAEIGLCLPGPLSTFLSNVYPDYNWLPWKFDNCPHNYWTDLKNQRKFLDWAATELNIKDKSDWYQVAFRVTGYHYIFSYCLGNFL
jgi:hypothetical protein